MAGYTEIASSAHERLMKIVRDELNRFERQEIEFRKSERRERAAELQLPIAPERPKKSVAS